MLSMLPNETAFYKNAEVLYNRATTVNYDGKSISSRQQYLLNAINEITPNLFIIETIP